PAATVVTMDVTLGEASAATQMEKAGAGTLILTQSATYTGATTVSAGTLHLGGGAANVMLSGAIAVSSGATLVVETVASSDYVLTNVVSGSGAMTVAGTGTLSFESASSGFAGTTMVVSGAGLSGTAAGSLGGTTTIADGGLLVADQAGTGHGLTLETLVLTAGGFASTGSIMAVNLTTAGAAGLFAVTDVALEGIVRVNQNGTTLGDGVYALIDAANAPTGSGLKIDRANSNLGDLSVVSVNGANQVVLTVGDDIDPDKSVYAYWNGTTAGMPGAPGIVGGAGTWDGLASSTNWTNSAGTTSGPWTAGRYARFQGTGGAVTVQGTIAGVEGLVFDVDGYQLSGGALALQSSYSDNRADIMVTASGATAAIGSDLSGNGIGINVTGPGTLVLSGSKSFTGLTSVQSGTLQLGDQTAAAGLSGALEVLSGATLAGVANGGNAPQTIVGLTTLDQGANLVVTLSLMPGNAALF
ncbi:autotransporter-associated beta strand repeat-containing protein, partial [Martelella limonii]|uniref:autotransporter-associated beta strand repeat-containing protein n=1 Tax=Martelella limonii TaxID=1647649 RepID=UPI0015803778